MATTTEYLKTLIETAGGNLDLPDNLKSTHYKALIDALANGTGGGGTAGGEYTVLVDETITNETDGITQIKYTDIDFHQYEDIFIYFTKPANASVNTSGDRKISVAMLGYLVALNMSMAGVDGSRDAIIRVKNMGNGYVLSDVSVANGHYWNPAQIYGRGFFPMSENYRADRDNVFNIEFNTSYIGTVRLVILAK